MIIGINKLIILVSEPISFNIFIGNMLLFYFFEVPYLVNNLFNL